MDEADIVKTMGPISMSYPVTHSISSLHTRPSPRRSSPRQASPGRRSPCYLYDDKVALICRDYREPEFWRCEPGRCTGSPGIGDKTIIYIFSVEDPADPVLEREVENRRQVHRFRI